MKRKTINKLLLTFSVVFFLCVSCFIGLFYNSKMVKANSETQTPAVFYAENGGAVSLTKNKPRLGFKTIFNKTWYEDKVNKGYSVTFGGLLSSAVEDITTLTPETPEVINNKFNFSIEFDKNDEFIYYSSIYYGNVPSEYLSEAYSLEISYRGYAILTKDGASEIVYADYNDNVRSMRAIANMAIRSGEYFGDDLDTLNKYLGTSVNHVEDTCGYYNVTSKDETFYVNVRNLPDNVNASDYTVYLNAKKLENSVIDVANKKVSLTSGLLSETGEQMLTLMDKAGNVYSVQFEAIEHSIEYGAKPTCDKGVNCTICGEEVLPPAHTYSEEFEEEAMAYGADCKNPTSYYKACTLCGTEGIVPNGEAGGCRYDLIISEKTLVEGTTDTYYLSCPGCGKLSLQTTTINEFIGVENGMHFNQLDGFTVEIPQESRLEAISYTVKKANTSTILAEYNGGSLEAFNNTFKTLSPKYVYLLEYAVKNAGSDTQYTGSVDFHINTADTVALAQTKSEAAQHVQPKGAYANITYTEGSLGGRKAYYEWTASKSNPSAKQAIISVYETPISKKSLVVGNYFYFDIYTTHDFPLTVLDGGTRTLYSKSYDHIRKFNSSTGKEITEKTQTSWKGKWVTIEVYLQNAYNFDQTNRFITVPAESDYGLGTSDSKHIYLDNFRVSSYSLYDSISEVEVCETHTFNGKVPQIGYEKSSATCQSAAEFYVSCSVCGLSSKGTASEATFTAGGVGEHAKVKNTSENYLLSDKTCTMPAIYSYSCAVCGKALDETFVDYHGGFAKHVYDNEVILEKYFAYASSNSEETYYYKSCICGKAGTEVFKFDPSMPESITVTVNPNRTTYCNGETFDPTGIVVTAQLYNGNTEIAEELSYSHSELSYPLQSITVSYKGIETELSLTVYEFTIQDAIVEVASAYDRQGGQIHYDQYQSRRHLTVSPEEATAQKMILLDCSSYVNSIYRETFGVNIMPYEIKEKNCSTEGYAVYAKNNPDNVDVLGFWLNEEYKTTEEQVELLNSIKEQLQVGDVLNYRHYRPASNSYAGHVYIYLGNDKFMHCYAGGSFHYDRNEPLNSWEEYKAEGDYGMIDTIMADALFTDTTNYRYLFKNTSADRVYSIALFRPLNRGLTITQKAMDRMKIAGLSLEKVSSVGVNSAVKTGDVITYTVTMENKVSTKHTGVTISDVLPAGTAYVDGSGTAGVTVEGKNLVWTGDVDSKATVKVSYSVKVTETQAGKLITSDSTYVSGIKLSTIVQTVSGYSQAQIDTLVEKANGYVAGQTTFSNPIDFAKQLYNEALGVNLFDYTTVESVLDDLIDSVGLTRRTDTAVSKMIAHTLYGGYDIRTGQKAHEDSERTRLVSEAELAVGDIILAEWSGGSRIYLYIGNSKLLCVEKLAESGSALSVQEVVIGDDIYGDGRVDDDFADNILVSLIAYDRFAVLRPSMVA